MTIQSTGTKSTELAPAVQFGPSAKTTLVSMSPAELVALCAVGLEGFDAEVARRTAAQRKDTNALKVLGELKAKMEKYRNGLDDSDDGDSKRAGGDSERGRAMRGKEFDELQAAFNEALAQLPPEYAEAARNCLDTMNEKRMRQFDGNQAATMAESIEAKTSDITTRQQAEMAEINNLISKRSNMIEMTKNIATALNGQQEFISRNAPR